MNFSRTDLLIQQTIRKNFMECTVLTIAHRLHTIIDSNRVLIMDSGSVVKFDEPKSLLQNENSVFYGMIKELGTTEFEHLPRIAKNKLGM